MQVTKVIIRNFKCLEAVNIALNPQLTMIVGDNEVGKTTLLEAIHLALTGRLNGRPLQGEMTPHLVNQAAAQKYLDSFKDGGKRLAPPEALIEVHIEPGSEYEQLRGNNNIAKEDSYGIYLKLLFDDAFSDEYKEYLSIEKPRAVPIEFYRVEWRSFAAEEMSVRSIPIKSTLIDGAASDHGSGANRHVLRLISDVLSAKERAGLSLSYRSLKEEFLTDPSVAAINKHLADQQALSDKRLSVSMDVSSRATWEAGIAPQLNEIPFALAGKGEQRSVSLRLAMQVAEDKHVFLVEEPENHLSFARMTKLVEKLAAHVTGKQLIVTTHSSFVLNKLGIENTVLFSGREAIRLTDLPKDTAAYFKKLPGHDTLRMILSRNPLLVEGPSDELMVQKAYLKVHKKTALEDGVDIISVRGVSFKRFLEIGRALKLPVRVVTDNDGSVDKLRKKYEDFGKLEDIPVFFDPDISCKSLEQQVAKCNSLERLNSVLGRSDKSVEDAVDYMLNNKAEWALRVFEAEMDVVAIPQYILNAVQ